jgi:hypothetical protein
LQRRIGVRAFLNVARDDHQKWERYLQMAPSGRERGAERFPVSVGKRTSDQTLATSAKLKGGQER